MSESNGVDKSPGVTIGPGGRKMYSQEFQDAVAIRFLNGEPRKALYEEHKVHSSMVARWAKNYKASHKRIPKAAIVTASTPKQVKKTYSKRQPGADLDPVKVRAAIGYLKHAKTAMYAALQQGNISEFDEAHLLTLAALHVILS